MSENAGQESGRADKRASPVSVKRPTVVLCALGAWAVLVFFVIWPWMCRFEDPELGTAFSIAAHVSAILWWLVLLWGLHHLAFQVVSIFGPRSRVTAAGSGRPTVAVLYATCDDFDPRCCQSCLDQDYGSFRVLVCDDSRQPEYRKTVEDFCAKSPGKCVLVRRPDRRGFKAGNLNHAIATSVKEEWVLIVDADQMLPRDYLSMLVSRLPESDDRVAFVQAAQEPATDDQSSPLQTALAPEVSWFYSYDLPARRSHGFLPMFGHGAMIRTSAFEALGGFPEVVSEDFALSLRAAAQGQRGEYVVDVVSREALPYDFGGFVIRMRKFAGGTAELIRRWMIPFLLSPVTLAEKWDFTMMLSWYVLMPFVTANGFLAAWVCHGYWVEDFPYLHPALPFLYTWLVLLVFAFVTALSRSWVDAVRFYFWSTAIYTATLPLAAWSFIKHLVLTPSFARTPKNREQVRLGAPGSVFMVLLGCAAVALSAVWISPFSPVLAGQGAAYLCYPLYGRLCSKSPLGTLARAAVYLPGVLMLFGLYAMWRWAYFM
jgi:cellulose synthase/poly-beta-1,6-N-acetylglucosamine synthase-like glycosyltransferase